MRLFDKIKRRATTVVETYVEGETREGRVHDLDLAAPGDTPSAGALADAAAQTPDVAHAWFADVADAAWSVERSWVSDGYAIVTTRPSVDVGYDQVALAFRCKRDQAFPVGRYVPNDDGWVLLDAAGPMPQQLGDT